MGKECVKDAEPLKKHSKSITYSALFYLFLFGSIFGFVFEGLWCITKVGHWENHSALVWGPFCIVYGFGTVAIYLFSCWLYKKNVFVQFAMFSIAGAVVEYFTSLFQEIFFGSTSWNYSHHPFNIGGRVSLQMAAVWGVLGILFIRFLYQYIRKQLEKLHGNIPAVLSIVLSVFMVANFAVSGLAVLRWSERQRVSEPSNQIERILDKYYDDEKMEKIYCNMRFQ